LGHTVVYVYGHPSPEASNCIIVITGVERGLVGGMAHNLHEMFLKLFDNILFIRIVDDGASIWYNKSIVFMYGQQFQNTKVYLTAGI